MIQLLVLVQVTSLAPKGIVNIPSRILIGTIADRKIITAVDLNTVFMLLGTIAIGAYYFLTSFWTQIAFAVVYAVAIGSP